MPTFDISRHTFSNQRHTTSYLASGPVDGPVAICVHGWPELAISWRNQLPLLASLGFRAIAPDMRGYGHSTVYDRHEDYAVEEAVQDMLELLDHVGGEQALWIGHDWGSAVVWAVEVTVVKMVLQSSPVKPANRTFGFSNITFKRCKRNN